VSDGARLVVVDDEAGLRALLEDFLGLQGFAVRTADSILGLEAALAEGPVDLILLDVNMPGEDGLSALARLRAAGLETAVIFLTAQDGPGSRVAGLGRGADDYVVKPFAPRELLARIRAVLRRMPPPSAAAAAPRAPVRFGDCRLDLVARRLTDAAGAEIDLSAMEHDLLAVFARHPRQTLSRERLAELAHGRRLEPGERSVDIRMRRLRQKIERDPSAPRVLRTVHGEGYRFEPEG
jgi:DNA-binding response OmpR family regulator